ncbi:hypothetical protein PT2222_10173 [Paraburkholderia tropica]
MPACLLNHARDEVQSVLYRGRGALEGLAIHGFGHGVLAQAQRDVLDLLDRVRERRDARGVHGLHLLDEPEEVIQALERIAGLGFGQFEAREMRDALHIGQGQGHAVTGK